MGRTKRVGLLSMCERVSPPDMKRVAILTRRAKGDRTAAAFAEACGIHPATMSRILNTKFKTPLSDDTIAAIAVNAEVCDGAFFQELLNAHGLVIPSAKGRPAQTQLHLYSDFLDQVRSGVDMSFRTKSDAPHVPSYRADSLKKRIQETIQTALIRAGYSVTWDRESAAIDGMEFPWYGDFVLQTNALMEEGLSKWAFDVCESVGNGFVREFERIAGMAYFGRPAEHGFRITLVTTDWKTFYASRKTLEMYREVYDSLSILLVNPRTNQVEAEYIKNRNRATVSVFPAGVSDEEVDWQAIYG